jgi:hypothetical protein
VVVGFGGGGGVHCVVPCLAVKGAFGVGSSRVLWLGVSDPMSLLMG